VTVSCVYSGAEDRHVHIWHRQSGAKVAALQGHTDVVNSVAFNPANPKMLVSGSDDGKVKVWVAKKLARQVSQC
jgi:F-box/WD-40 domain protein 5